MTLSFAIRTWLQAACLLFAQSVSAATQCPEIQGATSGRLTAVISDLHFGVGKRDTGEWSPTEDFRWSNSLSSFLDRISTCGKDAVDLVVAGDALELWQPPPSMRCDGPPETQCKAEHFIALISLVAGAHRSDLENLGRFAARGSNRLFIVPGNHDAALVLPGAWDLLSARLGAGARASLVPSGVWVSEDGQVVVEHGHQVGEDVNRYPDWPRITGDGAASDSVVTPWGERFVQRLFNEQEEAYPVIDNLSPESAGARFRMQDRGLWASASDVARFLRFNLFETTLSQKVSVLGPGEDGKTPVWDLTVARSKGHRLFTMSLPAGDPFVQALGMPDDQSRLLRAELDRVARSELSDDEVRGLCDLMAIRTGGGERCMRTTAGAAAQTLLHSKRSVVGKHVKLRLGQPSLERMRLFVYGHTHQLETEWTVDASSIRRVSVFNTGAFQRVVDENGFLSRAKERMLEPGEALRRLTVEDLAPCYSAVVVARRGTLPVGRTVLWRMDEGAGAVGSFTSPGDPACK